MKSTHLLVLAFLIVGIAPHSFAQISISSAKSMSLGTTVSVIGIATSGPELGDVRYMQDGTAGIAIYDPTTMVGVIAGDSIEISGPLTEFNQLMEIGTGGGTVTLNVLSSGNPLPTPADITIGAGFIETYEGQLVRIPAASFTTSGAFLSSDANYDISDATGTGVLRVNDETNIDGTLIPTDPIDMIGILGQFDFTDPAAGYQLLPRDLADLVTGGTPPVISTPLTQTNLATTSFTVSFETLADGNTILNYGATEAMGTIVSDAASTTSHTTDLSGLTPGTIYFIQGASVSASNDTSYSPITPMATVSESTGEMIVYFNQPVNNSVSTGTNAIWLDQAMDDSLIAYIDRAQNTLEIAIYNIDNNLGVIDAINAAFTRGVDVRLVANGGVNTTAYNLISIGTGNKFKSPVTSSTSFALMHNKFVVRDADMVNDSWLWTGSTNFTSVQLQGDPNNSVLIQDQTLAKVYRHEFEEMFSGIFNEDKQANTPTEFIINGSRVEVYFGPTDGVEDRIKKVIQQAEHDIHFGVFNWTRFSISSEVADAVASGAFAAGIIDDIDESALQWTILNDAMPGTLYKNSVHGIFHHKYLLSDAQCPASDPMVLTGSSNFSSNGTVRSDENIIIIHNADIANQFYQEFVARYYEEGGTMLSEIGMECEVVEPPMGIANTIKEELTLYPNPVSDFATVQIPANYNQGQIEIWDLSGKLLHVTSFSGNAATQIDMREFSNGLYTVRIVNDANNIAAGQLMKLN